MDTADPYDFNIHELTNDMNNLHINEDADDGYLDDASHDAFNETTQSIQYRAQQQTDQRHYHNNEKYDDNDDGDNQTSMQTGQSNNNNNNEKSYKPSSSKQQHNSKTSAQLTESYEMTKQRIDILQESLSKFKNELKSWSLTHTNNFNTLKKTFDDGNNEYKHIKSHLSKERGTWSTRYNNAISEASHYEQQLHQLQHELTQTNDKHHKVQQELRAIKQKIVQLQAYKAQLFVQFEQHKDTIQHEIAHMKLELQKYSLFLGLEIEQDIISNNNNNNNNNTNPNNTDNIDNECLKVRYTSLNPQLTFTLFLEPVLRVCDINLNLSGYQQLQKELQETGNLHQFLVKLYFLHKSTYPNMFPNITNESILANRISNHEFNQRQLKFLKDERTDIQKENLRIIKEVLDPAENAEKAEKELKQAIKEASKKKPSKKGASEPSQPEARMTIKAAIIDVIRHKRLAPTCKEVLAALRKKGYHTSDAYVRNTVKSLGMRLFHDRGVWLIGV